MKIKKNKKKKKKKKKNISTGINLKIHYSLWLKK